jgi:hypothetical protein
VAAILELDENHEKKYQIFEAAPQVMRNDYFLGFERNSS